MSATDRASSPATVATPPLDFDVFDAKCAERGALNETTRAELVGVDRVTLWRWRNGHQKPSFDIVRQLAAALEVSVDDLIGGRTHPPSGPSTPPPPPGPKQAA